MVYYTSGWQRFKLSGCILASGKHCLRMSPKIMLIGALMCTALLSKAQRQAIPPQQPREADMHYSKRTWRVIELREKQNIPAMWPKNPLSKVLYDAAAAGKLRAYKNDSLTSFYDLEQFFGLGSDTLQVKTVVDPNEDESYKIDTVIDRFVPEQKIRQLLLLEEWYFDKRSGQQRAQIIAIAPLYAKTVAGIDLGYIPLCWFKYYDRFDKETDCRDVLVNALMYNAGNPYQRFTYDDWFEQRNFYGFVVKESNPYDIFIMDDPEVKRQGLEALIEAGRVKQQTLEQEHDMYEH